MFPVIKQHLLASQNHKAVTRSLRLPCLNPSLLRIQGGKGCVLLEAWRDQGPENTLAVLFFHFTLTMTLRGSALTVPGMTDEDTGVG